MRRRALATVRLRRVTRRSWLIASTRMIRSPAGRTFTFQNALAVSQKGVKSVNSRTSQLYQPRRCLFRLHMRGQGIGHALATAPVDQALPAARRLVPLGLVAEERDQHLDAARTGRRAAAPSRPTPATAPAATTRS